MKKLHFIFIAVLTFATCHAQKQTLKLNLEKGKTYTQKMTANTSMNQTIEGRQLDSKIQITGMMAYTVTDIQNEMYEMEVSYKNLGLSMSLPSGTQQWSSDNKDESDIMSTILGSMIDQPFGIKLTTSGRVIEVKNIEVLFGHLFDKFPQLAQAQQEQLKAQLMKSYGEKAIKGNLEMCLAIFPDTPVTQGDTWKVNTRLESTMDARISTTYTFSDIQKSYYTISGVSDMKTVDSDTYFETNGMSIKYVMAGSMISEIKVNPQTGWVNESAVEQKMSGTAYILDGPNMPGGMEMPMSFTTLISVTEK
ncbi:MAG: DUF6263 family protein [Bacteroidales bacterium]